MPVAILPLGAISRPPAPGLLTNDGTARYRVPQPQEPPPLGGWRWPQAQGLPQRRKQPVRRRPLPAR